MDPGSGAGMTLLLAGMTLLLAGMTLLVAGTLGLAGMTFPNNAVESHPGARHPAQPLQNP